jgi:transposase InsO family protein
MFRRVGVGSGALIVRCGRRCVHRHTFATRAEARLKTATWITDFYNTKRRHSAAGGKPPVEFERIIQEARAQTDQEGRAA